MILSTFARVSEPDKDTWADEFFLLCQEFLKQLEIPFIQCNLEKVTLKEYTLAFRLKPQWPNHISQSYVKDTEDPSKQLEAVMQVLRRYELEPITLSGNLEGLSEVDGPAIIVMNSDPEDSSGKLAILNSITDNVITYWHPAQGRLTVSSQAFAVIWSGVLLQARHFPQSGERNYKKEKTISFLRGASKLGVGLTAASLVLVSGIIISQENSTLILGSLVVGALKLLGLFLCISLYKVESTDKYSYRALEQFCTLKDNFSCQRVLASKGSRLFGVISMSDIGLTYFGTSGLIFVAAGVIQGDIPGLLSIVSALNLFCLPYTLFSITYQMLVVRAWCMLCVAVQITIWLEFFTFARLWYLGVQQVPALATAALAVAGIIAGIAWSMQRRQLKEAKWEAQKSDYSLRVLQRNSEGFTTFLCTSIAVDDSSITGDLVLGNRSAPIHLLAILDPQCHRCGHCWEHLKQWVARYPDRLWVTVRIMAAYTPLTTMKDLLCFTVQSQNNLGIKLLDKWYAHRIKLRETAQLLHNGKVSAQVYDFWKKENRVIIPHSNEKIQSAYSEQIAWEQRYAINVWPSLFVNGRAWPPYYDRLTYLPYYLDEIETLVTAKQDKDVLSSGLVV